MYNQSLLKLSFILFFGFIICQVIELVIFKQSTFKLWWTYFEEEKKVTFNEIYESLRELILNS